MKVPLVRYPCAFWLRRSYMILQELNGEVLRSPYIHKYKYIYTYEALHQGLVEEILWRSWWNPVRGPCIIQRSCAGPCEKILWRSCWHPLRGPCMILHVSLWEDPAEILAESSLRGPCRSLHDLAQVLNRRSCGDPGKVLSQRSLHKDPADAMS